ncbi:hypothetical protein Vafri_11997 [Volvox africanus]|uniref:peptidylprolyl isomerase n=1 Tax=Volvox africanus TaxID=51714 RepID=A0A8J4B8R0_9CHLO|nr:hypothetical protein Vafri_11997 [Volvox africanus]
MTRALVSVLGQALTGMTVGGRRTVRVPPALGFGSQTVLAPYGVVPANSTLLYEVELLRLSAVGPDQLTKVRYSYSRWVPQSRTPGTTSVALYFKLPSRCLVRICQDAAKPTI